jgi:hypothetical protein
VFPVGFEVSNADRIAWILNENAIPYILDGRTLMRQLYIANLASGGYIGGSVYGIRSTASGSDIGALPATYCNGLCPPLYDSASVCRIGASLAPAVYPVSPVDFMYWDEALLYCPYNQFVIWDNNATISPAAMAAPFSYSLYNMREPVPNSQMRTYCRNTGTGGSTPCKLILGPQPIQFTLLGCGTPGSTFLPTDVLFQNIELVFPSSGGALQFVSHSQATDFGAPCNSSTTIPIALNSVQFTTTKITSLASSSSSGSYLIQCLQCRVRTFLLDNTVWNLGGETKGIYYEPARDFTLDSIVVRNQYPDTLQSNSTAGAFAPYALLKAPRSVEVSFVFSLPAVTNTLASIHLYDVSRLSGPPRFRRIKMIGSAPPSSAYPLIGHMLLIESLDNLTSLAQIPTLYTSGVTDIEVNPGGYPMVGGFAAPNMLSFYPCVNGTCVFIQTLVSNSPLTKPRNTGIYQEWFYADTPSFQILNQATSVYYPTLTSDCLFSRRSCSVTVQPAIYFSPHHIELLLAVAVVVFIPILTWLFLCGGITCLFGNVGLRVTRIPEPLLSKKDIESSRPMLSNMVMNDDD